MSRTQNLRWKRKAVVVAAVAASFAGYAAISASTVSASNYGEWDCSESEPLDISGSNYDECTVPTDYTDDTVPADSVPVDSVPVDSVPVDSVPVDTTPVDTDPEETDPPVVTTAPPSNQQLPPTPVAAAPVTPVVAPAQVVAPEVVPSLPVTGRGSALPSAFIAIGLLGAGSVALAFARRNSATRTNQS